MGGICRVYVYCVPDICVVVFQFLLSPICRVYVYCVPDICVVAFLCLLSPTDWGFVVSDGSIGTRSCFGQVVCPLVSFKTCVSLTQWKVIEAESLSLTLFQPSGNG